MNQNRVNEFVDKTIGSLCGDLVDIKIIINRLRENSSKYEKTLLEENPSKTKSNYLRWYIEFANKRVNDLENISRMALNLNRNRPDQIFKLMKFREKITSNLEEKIVQFD